MTAKIFKTLLMLCAAAAFSFAQTADSTKQQPVQTAEKGLVVPDKTSFNLPTEVKPKQPTNWSKIKDLFL